MRVVAYGDEGYAADLGYAFLEGARRHGARCLPRCSRLFQRPERADVVWLYGMHAMEHIFNAYEGLALRVVGDLGYWREGAARLPMHQRPVRISLNAQQPDRHLRLRRHPPDRLQALQLPEPVQKRGEYILVAGHDPLQARRHGLAYGQWELETIARVRAVSSRQVLLREKPGCERLSVNITRGGGADITVPLRNAWAVCCLTGNVGADAILHGVPCCAQSGPGAVYAPCPLEWIDDAVPLAPAQRLAALADLAYWQWTPEEMTAGALWAHLRQEVLH